MYMYVYVCMYIKLYALQVLSTYKYLSIDVFAKLFLALYFLVRITFAHHSLEAREQFNVLSLDVLQPTLQVASQYYSQMHICVEKENTNMHFGK